MLLSWLGLVLIVIASLVLPKWLLLVFFIPILMVLSFGNLIPPLFSIGSADIWIFDLILLVIAFRVAGPIILRRRAVYTHPIYSAIVLFLSVLLVATMIAYYRFGEEIFIGEMIAFLRFLAQVSVLFLVAYSIETTKQLILIQKLVQYLGYGIAAIIYLNVVLFSVGIQIGEVQATGEIVRYFGPLGDQVGFILPFFIYKNLIDRNLIGTLFFAGALFATGTRGTVLALLVGIVVMLFQMRNEMLIGRRGAVSLVGLAILASLMVLLDFGGIRSRFTGAVLEGGLTQRLTTIELALQVFLDNFLTGVGYTGVRYLALDYGAREIFSEWSYFAPNFIETAGNQFLQTATDGGILALLSFIGMNIVFLQVLKSTARNTKGEISKICLAGYIWLLSLLIGNQTAAWLLPGSMISYLLWIILGLAVAVKRASHREGIQERAVTVPPTHRTYSGVGL